ncbi:MAG: peptidoglycan editing factor PgeF [Gammaproteobacteria bacterium]|nr:peptidoglycan editing factor PgeF [Gammaproteobacteria bacterium]
MTCKRTIAADWVVSSRIVAFSTTRQGGVSELPYASFNLATHVGDDSHRVASNRALLPELLPRAAEWQWLEQVHGNAVVIVNKAGPPPTADAMLTTRPNLVCCVQTADCLPVFVAALDGTEVAVIHAGWKGLASGVIENTISRMSTSLSSLAVWLGPAIGPCHFEVGAQVRDSFLAVGGSSSLDSAMEACFISSTNQGKFMADMYAIARLKLSALGIVNISGGNYCTYCDNEQFFSYRRDGITGRMLNAIYIEA